MPAQGIVFFDVDGTLVPGTSTSQHLAHRLGHFAELSVAEAAYDAGTLTNQEACVLDALAWRGRTPDEIHGWLASLPVVDGIADTVAWCRIHRLEPYLATLAWEPVARYLATRFGLAGCCGPTLSIVDGRYSGDVDRHFDEHDKRDFAAAVAAAAGVPLSACAAVGDSRSDLPLFAEVGLSIAFNATAAVKAIATHAVDGADLRAILPYVRSWRAAL
jgi:phosphoserine phosphatase